MLGRRGRREHQGVDEGQIRTDGSYHYHDLFVSLPELV